MLRKFLQLDHDSERTTPGRNVFPGTADAESLFNYENGQKLSSFVVVLFDTSLRFAGLSEEPREGKITDSIHRVMGVIKILLAIRS